MARLAFFIIGLMLASAVSSLEETSKGPKDGVPQPNAEVKKTSSNTVEQVHQNPNGTVTHTNVTNITNTTSGGHNATGTNSGAASMRMGLLCFVPLLRVLLW